MAGGGPSGNRQVAGPPSQKQWQALRQSAGRGPSEPEAGGGPFGQPAGAGTSRSAAGRRPPGLHHLAHAREPFAASGPFLPCRRSRSIPALSLTRPSMTSSGLSVPVWRLALRAQPHVAGLPGQRHPEAVPENVELHAASWPRTALTGPRDRLPDPRRAAHPVPGPSPASPRKGLPFSARGTIMPFLPSAPCRPEPLRAGPRDAHARARAPRRRRSRPTDPR